MLHRVKTHVFDNLWLWTIVMVALSAAAFYVRNRVGAGYHFGDIAALALMIGATFVIIISQRQFHQTQEEHEER